MKPFSLGRSVFGKREARNRLTRVAATLVLLLSLALSAPRASAQQRPEVGYVDPPGGRAGTTIDVRLGGYDFTPDTQFLVLDPRVSLELLGPPSPQLHPGPPHWFGPRALNSNKAFPIPREVPARLTIPADMPPGVIRWQAANANGASSIGQFVIGEGLDEIREADCPVAAQSTDGQAQAAPPKTSAAAVRELPSLPLTVSGCLQKKEEVDRYRFVARSNGLVTCELPAAAFGYPLNAVLEVRNARGERIADAADPTASGLSLTFAAEAGESYELTLYDLDYRGDRALVYRLTLRDGPQVVAALPAAGRPGETRPVRFVGYGVETGQARLESTLREVTFPADARPGDSLSYRLETPFGTAGPFTLGISELLEDVEPDLAASAADPRSPAMLTVPGAITGTLHATSASATSVDDASANDAYRFTGRQGESYWIAVEARSVGSPLDVSLTVFDAAGKQLGENDDLPGTTDAGLLFQVPADGEYTVVVRDLSGITPGAVVASDEASASGLDRVYRLSIAPPQPTMRLIVPDRAETIVGAAAVEPPQKGRKPRDPTGLLIVDVERSGGFNDPVRLELTGLPPGIAPIDELLIPADQTSVSIPLTCPAEASSSAALATVRATSVPTDPAATPLQDEAVVLVAPKLKPRAVVRPLYPDAGRTVYRGATYPAPVVIERLEGYEGPVELELAAIPDRVRQGIIGGELVVPADVVQVDFPLFLPEWVQTDRTSRIVLNTVVRFPDGQAQQRYLVNRMEKRITMNVEGAVLKVAADTSEFAWDDDELRIPLRIFRTPRLAGPVRIGLAQGDYSQKPPVDRPADEPDEPSADEVFRADPLQLDEDQTEAALQVTTKGTPLTPGEHVLTIEARGVREGHPVVSRTEVIITVPSAPSPPAATAAAEPALHRRIDELLARGRDASRLAPPAGDAEFLRRIYLDLAGRIPTAAEARRFFDDASDAKRAALIDQLLAGPDYPRRMQELFDAMLMERRGTHEDWERFLRYAFEQNLPWDQIAHAIVRPDADHEETRGAAYFMTARLVSEGAMAPVDVPGLTRDVGRLLVGVDLQCAQCHDHISINDYTQRDFQGLHMVFENVETRRDVKFPAVSEKVLAAPKSFMSVFVQEEMTTTPVVPGSGPFEIVTFPAGEEYLVAPDRKARTPGVPKFSPLAELADRLASADNELFCRNIVNRLWFAMLGHGLVEPLDLHHRDNPATHPELLDLLVREFAAQGLNIRWFLRELALTEAYQRSSLAGVQTSDGAAPTERYARAAEKRLQAETLFWSTLVATESLAAVESEGPDESLEPERDEEPEATANSSVRARLDRAVEASADLRNLRERFQKAFANPAKEPEIDFEPSVKGALFLMHDPRLLKLLEPQAGNLVERLAKIEDAGAVADELFLAILSRAPTDADRRDVIDYLAAHSSERPRAIGDLAWALMASTEFCVNH